MKVNRMDKKQFVSVGKNGIRAKIIADSICNGKRMTTFELEFFRFILPEFNTHRALSKNLQSSRAVPLKTSIALVKENPAIPVHFGKNQPGMVSKEEFEGTELESVKALWKVALDQVISVATVLDFYKPHKQWAARILEPFTITKAVVSGTNWDNMLWLRDDEEAQPEFQVLGSCINECFANSTPVQLQPGHWHLPYVDFTLKDNGYNDIEQIFTDPNGNVLTLEEAKQISASCCAQISYRKLNDTKEKALEIFGKLFSGRKPHMSPTEHQATPVPLNVKPYDISTWPEGVTHVDRAGSLHSGNLDGWIQYRQTLPNNVFVKTA